MSRQCQTTITVFAAAALLWLTANAAAQPRLLPNQPTGPQEPVAPRFLRPQGHGAGNTVWGPTPIAPPPEQSPDEPAEQPTQPRGVPGTFFNPLDPTSKPPLQRPTHPSQVHRPRKKLAVWPPPDHLRAMMEDAEIADLHFVDPQRGWAVGDRGVIWHTADGGRTWKLQRSTVDCRLDAVWFLDGYTGWAVGGFTVPYTHRTQGVVLRTRDGGRRWQQVDDGTLPALNKVKFQTNVRGWAVGVPSPLYPAGVFTTTDGGRNWRPLPDQQGGPWLCGDFRDSQHGVVAGRDGMVAVATARGMMKSKPLHIGLRHVRDIALVDRGGWLVGDGGLLMGTVDGGLSWQLPEGDLPPAVAEEFDLHAVAAHGPRVWAVGSPGTIIHHSPDGGATWRPQITGQPLPLKTLHFVDEKHGWAAGSLGTILATRDGGQTWHRQKSGGTRAGLLGVFGDEQSLPLEMFARLSGEEGYLGVAEIVARRDIEVRDPLVATAEVRSREAMHKLGGSAANHSWRFPLRQRGLRFSTAQLSDLLNDTHDGRGTELLEAHLVRQIRQWRPEVLVTHDASPTGEPLAYLVHQIVMRAVEKAGDSTAYTDQLTLARLQPWQVKKVFAHQSGDRLGEVAVSTPQLAPRLGGTLADSGTAAYGLLAGEYQVRPASLNFRLLKGGEADAKRDFFSGLNLPHGGEARRKASNPPAGDFGQFRRLAQRKRHVERLLDPSIKTPWPDEAWLGQINQLTQGLSEDAAGQLLFQMGDRYARTGRRALAAECFHSLAERYPDHAMTEQAMRWLIAYAASGEAAWQAALTEQRKDEATSDAVDTARLAAQHGQGGVQQAAFNQPTNQGPVVQSVAQTNQMELRVRRMQALARRLEQRHLSLAMDPSIRMAVAGVLRGSEHDQQAKALYSQLAAGTSPWADLAKGEQWLATRRGQPPRPAFACQRASMRPKLDGNLNDRCWQNVEPVRLTSQLRDDEAWPASVMFTYDDEYLFVAVSCKPAEQSAYLIDSGVRQRDTDLSPHDRVELLIDIDRDYASFYRLAVDYRGWGGESLLGDATWNPQWFIGNGRHNARWTAEAAIPLSELTQKVPASGDAWAINVQRIVPRTGFQAWSRPASAEGDAAGLGLMVFQ